MRVIFLDIDGVLNNVNTCQISGVWNQSKDTFMVPTEPDCVNAFNNLVQRSGAKVVISSSWRAFADWTQLGPALERSGLVCDIIGETPLPADSRSRVDAEAGTYERGMDIWCYLVDHPEVMEFVILDDGDDAWKLRAALVLTDPIYGLTASDVEQAMVRLVRSSDLLVASVGLHRDR